MAYANYIGSPSFETSGWQTAAHQPWVADSGGGSLTRQASNATNGSNSLRISSTSSGFGGYLELWLPAITDGVSITWTFSFDVTARSGNSTLTLRDYNNFPWDGLSALTISSTGRKSYTFTQTPTSPSGLRLHFQMGINNGFINIDSLRLTRGTSTTYIDGNSSGYTWHGTAGASFTQEISYPGVFNHLTRPRASYDPRWDPYWDSSSQTSSGMTVTTGLSGVTVSGQISRSSSTTYKDIGAISSPVEFQDLTPGATAYISATVSSVSGLGSNDTIRAFVDFYDGGGYYINSAFLTLPRTGGRDGTSLTVPSGAVWGSLGFTIYTPSGFTSSNHTVSATLDFFRLCTQVSTAYIDGDTAGYAWRPAVHNGVTIDTSPLEAAGSVSLPGTIESEVKLFLEGTTNLTISGTIDIFLDQVQASGALAVTGSADVWQYGPIEIDAALDIDGTIVIAALIPIEGSGTLAVEGTAEVAIAVPMFATNTPVVVTGSLIIGLPPDILGTGFLDVAGTVEVAIAGQTDGEGELVIIGAIEIAPRIPFGSFGDLALFSTTQTDPLRSITSGSNGGVLSGANGAEWSRVYAEFAAPQETTQWRRAAYAAVGIQFASVPANEWQEFTYVQAEVAPAGGPSEYKPAASLRPLVYPDRLNVHPHAISVVADPGPNWSGTPITSPIDGDVTGGLNVEVKTGQDMTITTSLDWLRPGATYTASMWIRIVGTDLTDISITATGAASTSPISDPASWSDASDDLDLGEGWRRIHCVFTAPDDGAARLFFDTERADEADDSFDVAGMLVEEGIEVRDYFWPLESSADIGYRSGYSDATGGIFYYKDRGRRTYILKQALKDQVPIGIGILDPEFFLIPHVDV